MTQAIINGGFESELNVGWIDLYAGTVRDDTEHYTGFYSAKFPNASGCAIYQTFTPIEQSDITTFEMYIKTPDFRPAFGYGAWILYEGWTPGSGNPAYHTTIEIWTQLVWGIVDLKNRLEEYKGKVIGIQLQSIGAIDWWVDDVSCEYTPPPPPIDLPDVETDIATDILSNSVTLHGEIIDIGIDNCDERGFEWGLESGIYTDDWTETGTYEVGIFSHNTIGFLNNKKYYFRAKAHNTDGWGYGSELDFTTLAGSMAARVHSVLVKDVYLKGVQSAHWKDSDPWVRIPIAAGDMLHHHLMPNNIEGVITCYDISSIWEAFYTSNIIIEATGEKTKFSPVGTEFVITLKDINNNDLIFNFTDVRITTIDLNIAELESGGEGLWTIRFTAKGVMKQ